MSAATLLGVSFWLAQTMFSTLRPITPAPLLPLMGPQAQLATGYLLAGTLVFATGLVNSIMLIWWERKLLGRFMDRRGAMHVGYAGLLQNFADGLKLFRKQPLRPREADKLGYLLSPTAYLATSLAIVGFLPVSTGWVPGVAPLSLLMALALFSFAPFFIFVGAWSSNNKYSLIGGMRTAAQLVAYEVPLLFAIVSVVLLAGTFDLTGIVNAQIHDGWFALPLALGLIIFFVAMLAEVERIPFDLPEAEAELVEGWNTEYGGMLFAMTTLGDYVRALVGSYLVVLLFLGGWWMPAGPYTAAINGFPLAGILWFQVKVYIVFAVFVWVRASLPRVRTDQLLQIGWKRMIPLSLANVFLAAAFVAEGWPPFPKLL
ncbi:MAG: NADH-quinone oxidoreductase subunit H [Euryarchaeota archaeon]|nr:NADH-quinone oxidoreductase subunit H [Euryarchaeota archaeon]MDE1835209.1 NADH-quinone oxidoreductase subunit H [Euryarchaeota archaeon]MDE1880066.1 NADH-quinone oxidoreductase subunit H [Euryarchaeota archaeon]MDE2043505.1 NADH-quinone oxidoreductase subunit H [Thermoplasmata archaeon]